MLSTENILHTPREKRDRALAARRKFVSHTGDHITFLNIIKAYRAAAGSGERAATTWCFNHFVNGRAMKQAAEVEQQLRVVTQRALTAAAAASSSSSIISRKRSHAGADLAGKPNLNSATVEIGALSAEPVASDEAAEGILRCLLAGLFQNTAVLQQDGTYRTAVTKQVVYIHPSSVLFGKNPPAVMYSEVVKTTKHYMRTVSEIQLPWLLDASPAYFGRLRR